MTDYFFEDNPSHKVKALTLAARCSRDAMVIANSGTVHLHLEIHDQAGEAKTSKWFIECKLEGERARELAGQLKKNKKVTLWVTVDNTGKLTPTHVEIDEGVLYELKKS